MVIESTAPGKLVLGGEYSIFYDGVAIVTAIDRFACCRLETTESGGWQISSLPSGITLQSPKHELAVRDGHELRNLFQLFEPFQDLPSNAGVTLDTKSFFLEGQKFGIGSSAAIVVALGTLLDFLCDRTTDLSAFISAHRQLQGGGSGLDVASAYHGGLIAYRLSESRPLTLSNELHLGYVFTGASTKTSEMLGRFERSVDAAGQSLVDEWVNSSVLVEQTVERADEFVTAIERQTNLWYRIDEIGKSGVFGAKHRYFYEKSKGLDLAYKPSGAGGGDIGIVIGTDREEIDAFLSDVSEVGCTRLKLGRSIQGRHVKHV